MNKNHPYRSFFIACLTVAVFGFASPGQSIAQSKFSLLLNSQFKIPPVRSIPFRLGELEQHFRIIEPSLAFRIKKDKKGKSNRRTKLRKSNNFSLHEFEIYYYGINYDYLSWQGLPLYRIKKALTLSYTNLTLLYNRIDSHSLFGIGLGVKIYGDKENFISNDPLIYPHNYYHAGGLLPININYLRSINKRFYISGVFSFGIIHHYHTWIVDLSPYVPPVANTQRQARTRFFNDLKLKIGVGLNL